MPRRSKSLSITGLGLGALLALISAGIVAAAAIAVLHLGSQQHQAQFGQALARQLAGLATKSLISKDLIELNVVTNHIANDPGVMNVAVLDDKQQLLSSGGPVPVSETANWTGADVFEHGIAFEQQIIGRTRIVLQPDATVRETLPWALLLVLSCGLAGAWLGYAVGRRQQRELNALNSRLLRNLKERGAAVGVALADTAAVNAITALEDTIARLDPAPQAALGEGAANDSEPPYLMVFNVFNQSSLAAADVDLALRHCEQRLRYVAKCYAGRITHLPGTGLVGQFNATDSDHAYHAICASLLALRLTTALNEERVAAGRKPLALRAGLTRMNDAPVPTPTTSGHRGAHVDAADDDDDVLNEPISEAVLLSATARNGTLAVSRELFESLDSSQRVQWSAIRSPLLDDDHHGRFHYQISDLAPSYVAPLVSQMRAFFDGRE